jgi:hypothetical protein
VHDVWTPVSEHPGYEITEWGRLRSTDRVIQCVNGAQRRLPGKELKLNPDSSGYLAAYVGGTSTRRIHVLVATTFIEPSPFVGAQCRHLNDDKLDNWVGNLAWGTACDNRWDMSRNGKFEHQQREVCPFGHPLAAPNLVPYKLKLGRRSCLACQRAHSQNFYLRTHGRAVEDHQALSDRYYGGA